MPRATAQEFPKIARESAEIMLTTIASDIRKHYYDPKFHGLDWDAVVRETKDKIDNSASYDVAILHIAAAVDELNDSHTVFLPPRTMVNASPIFGWVSNWRSLLLLENLQHSYGWDDKIIGDRCFVTRVRPGSDGEKKGLQVGDEIMSINGYRPERDTIARAEYVFNILRPQRELKLDLLDSAGLKTNMTVAAMVRERGILSQYEQNAIAIRAYEERQHLLQPRIEEVGDELEIIKLPAFNLPADAVEGLIGRARKYKALILDLRENYGGSEEMLQYLLGGLFEHEVKISNKVMRSGEKPLTTKTPHKTFNGKLVVLVDSRSASAAEVFARVVQIEKRGSVLGDRTAGEVVSAKYYGYQLSQSATWYGVGITEADLVMTDGKSLEHVGVTPDEIVIPTASDLAQRRDPVLAHAAKILGVELTPEAAGKLFPYQWPAQ